MNSDRQILKEGERVREIKREKTRGRERERERERVKDIYIYKIDS